MNNEKKKSTVRTTMLLLLQSIWLVFLLTFVSGNSSVMQMSMLSLVNAILLTVLLTLKQKKVFTMFNMFFILLCIFHFGQFWLYIFDVKIDTTFSYNIFTTFSFALLSESLWYSLIATNIVSIVALTFLVDTNIVQLNFSPANKFKSLAMQKKISSTSKFLFWILFIPVFYYDVLRIITGIQEGYYGVFHMSGNLIPTLESYFILPILGITYSGRSGSKWKFEYYYMLLRCFLLMLFTGSRIKMVVYILLLIYAKSKFISGFTKKQTTKMYILGSITLIIIPFIGFIRDPSNDLKLIEYLTTKNPVTLLVSEFGSTMVTTILAIWYVHYNGILAGKTFLGASTSLIPGSNYLFPNVKEVLNVGGVLNPYAPATGALGGSFFGEFYLSFAWWGLIGIAILTYFFVLCSNFLEKDNCKYPMLTYIALYLFYSIVIYVRGDFLDVILCVKRIFYYYIIFECCNHVLYSKITVKWRTRKLT